MRILYITHYGYTLKDFYCDPITNKPIKIIGDGGTNIHIHLIQYFNKKDAKIFLSTFRNNYQYKAFFEKFQNIKIISFWSPKSAIKIYNSLIENIYKIFFLPFKAFFVNTNYDFIISSTDFLPDVIYSFIIKARNPKIKWIASYLLDAPKPWAKNNPYKSSFFSFFSGFLYWLAQRFSYFFIQLKASIVLVTSKPDVKKFITKKRAKNQIVIIKGGVDVSKAKNYIKSSRIIPISKRKYDACFLGRLHYQKGVLELIDIWKLVCRQKPKAKLVMIGNGPLRTKMKKKIEINNLDSNIDLLNFKYGEKKIKIFKNSKVIVHPATYDSGGMSAAEGMVWGLPAVSFDLESLKTYYQKGMIKTECFNLKKFSDNILSLLNNKDLYYKTSKEAYNLIIKNWDWDKRAEIVYSKML